jgi:hypothetical protein
VTSSILICHNKQATQINANIPGVMYLNSNILVSFKMMKYTIKNIKARKVPTISLKISKIGFSQ